MAGRIGVVEIGELVPFRVGQRVEPDAGLFGRGLRRQPFGGGKLARKIGMGGQYAQPFQPMFGLPMLMRFPLLL